MFAWHGVAVSFDETYLPRDIGEKVAGNDLEAQPVFALLENKYDTPLVEAEYKLEAAAADPVAAQALKFGREPDLPDRTHVVYHRRSANRL